MSLPSRDSVRALVAASLALLCCLAAVRAVSAEDSRFAKWEPEIRAFEEQDRDSPPAPGGIVFVGSSSIRLWDLTRDFPDRVAINRGFGGSQVADSTHFSDRIVIPYQPRIVVLYAGDNDIAQDVSPCQVHENFLKFVDAIHAALPETRILYIAIKPSIKRWHLIHRVRAANALIRADCEEDERLKFIDIDPPMLGEDGRPRPELFIDDGLHLSAAGYAIWADVLRPQLGAAD